MRRRPRVEFPGAIYHLVLRSDERRKLFYDDGHYQRLTQGLQEEVQRSGWQVLAYCWMPNHTHLLIETPESNLARGMQHWPYSSYAGYARKGSRVDWIDYEHLLHAWTGKRVVA